MAAAKKTILFLGQPDTCNASQVQNSLSEALAANDLVPFLVWARDGADAASKIENQKFDAVVIDTQASRLRDGNFLKNISKHKSTGCADLIAILPSGMSLLPHELERASQVLQKPYDLDTLVRALCKSLSSPARVEANHKHDYAFAVDVRILNAVWKSTVYICQQFGLTSIEMQKPEVKAIGTPWKGDIATTMAIKSRLFQGALILSFEKSAYLKMYESMLGETHTELNDENSEAIGEICNMILGNAKSDFTNYDVEMTLPRPLKKHEAFSYPPGSASILISATSPAGHIFIEVVADSLTKP